MKLPILAIVVAITAFVVIACGGVAFTAANLPALAGNFERRADIAYGAGVRQPYDRSQLERVALPPGTVRGFIGLSGPYALDPNTDTYRAIFGAPFSLADWQPVQLARADAPPALLMHGEADEVVDIGHAHRMAAVLQGLGVPVTLRTYSGRGHRDTVAAFAAGESCRGRWRRLPPERVGVVSEVELPPPPTRRFDRRNPR